MNRKIRDFNIIQLIDVISTFYLKEAYELKLQENQKKVLSLFHLIDIIVSEII